MWAAAGAARPYTTDDSGHVRSVVVVTVVQIGDVDVHVGDLLVFVRVGVSAGERVGVYVRVVPVVVGVFMIVRHRVMVVAVVMA